MKRLVKLSKKDAEALCLLCPEEMSGEMMPQKNDILLAVQDIANPSILKPVLSKEGELILYRPLSKDSIAFTYADEKIYGLGELAKDVWSQFTDAVQLCEARRELGLSKEDSLDRKGRSLPFLRNVEFPKNMEIKNISIYLGSPAELAKYADYALKVEKIADKMEKQEKKLGKVIENIYQTKNREQESFLEEDLEQG